VTFQGIGAWVSACVRLSALCVCICTRCACLSPGVCVLHLQVRAILDVNGKVGLGVDGSSSNETVNLMDDCRIATYLQRSGGNPKGVFSYSVDVEMQLHVHRHLPLLLL